MVAKKKYYSQEAALLKLQNYCAYQERCHTEVLTKLNDLGVYGDKADEIVAQLITDNFLNEERFAVAFARGKFRIKKWGKVRIKQELKMRNIPEYSIKKAMMEIDTCLPTNSNAQKGSSGEGGYIDTLKDVIKAKAKDYEGHQQIKQKLGMYAISRGFEPELVWEVLNDNK